ncbi:hypothetical protein TSUD_162080 [Trifolium subterraneum]|uniref:Reverse transcriptase domain-containing protein n=1 Tax=Trifolium subterraneum TaxID=3900 RepID=A0A2Z6MR54_TRISU|nr:hypothetical protein TSUD_162080 [Trifolium subterraneum]
MISILINGSPSKEFKMERGLRQGDPLSPFLFLMVAEGLNVLINKAVADGSFVGYGVGREEKVFVSHLQFAYDTLIIGRKSWENIFAIKSILQLCELISGLKVNFNKSTLYGINVKTSWLVEAASALNCNIGELPMKYLGMPIGSRLVLLKSILSAMPIYYLSFFKMSSDEGWFEGNLRKLVGDGKNTNFWLDPWVDGDNLRSQFNRLFDIFLDRDKSVADMISDMNGEKKILWSWRRNLFCWEEELVEVCEGVVFGTVRVIGESDIWKWGDSDFSVKEAYLRLTAEDEEEVEWAKEVWNPLVPAKLSILVWCLLYDRLPTKDNLRLRGVFFNSSSLCVGGCGWRKATHVL